MIQNSGPIVRAFTEHPASVGETYFQHLASALGFAGHLAIAAMVCLCHALLPWLFCRSGSERIGRLYETMVRNRRRGGNVEPQVVEPNAS